MCRLVAYAGRPAPLAPLLFGGSHSLLRQSWAPRELLSGSVNADGWGVAWWDSAPPEPLPEQLGEGGEAAPEAGSPRGPQPASSGSPARRLAEPRPLWQEEELEGVLEGIRAGLAMGALRNATPGIPVDRSGLLPLTLGRWAFVLNGFVPRFRPDHMRALRRHLPDPLYGRLRGSSDSETLFLLAVAEMGSGAEPLEALLRVADRIRSQVGDDEAQLTMVLGSDEELAVLRTSTVAATNSLYLVRGHPLAPGGTLVASERLDEDPAWEELPAHASLRLTRRGVEVEALGS